MMKVDDMKTIAVVCVFAFLPGMAMSAPADAHQVTSPEQALVATAQGTSDAWSSVVETMRGFVAGVDQESDSISIRSSPETTEQFRVQDGLIFDAVRFGDLVEVSVQNIDGVKTVVGPLER